MGELFDLRLRPLEDVALSVRGCEDVEKRETEVPRRNVGWVPTALLHPDRDQRVVEDRIRRRLVMEHVPQSPLQVRSPVLERPGDRLGSCADDCGPRKKMKERPTATSITGEPRSMFMVSSTSCV